MSEYMMIVVMAVCGILFAIGGTGYKWARRFVLPLFLLAFAHTWMGLGMAISLIVALSLPYGSKTPYWVKALTFSTYGLSFLWIGWSWWIVITPVLCLSIFALSNWKPLANDFFWKACEFLYGVFIGITFIACLRA